MRDTAASSRSAIVGAGSVVSSARSCALRVGAIARSSAGKRRLYALSDALNSLLLRFTITALGRTPRESASRSA